MNPSRPPAWSFARRIALWFTAATTLLGCAIWIASAALLRVAAERELQALLSEEFDELQPRLEAEKAGPEWLERELDELIRMHPSNQLTWTVWSATTGERVLHRGRGPVPAQAMPAPMAPGRSAALGEERIWRAQRLAPDLVVALSITTWPQRRHARAAAWLLLGVVVVATALSSLGGAMFGRRVARELRLVAARVRAVRSPDEPVGDDRGAPEEIREVSDALRAMLEQIRDEAERVRIVTAGMAHELRSPIQTLLGETEVALLRERDASEYRALLQSNLDDLRDLARAVDNLVTLCGTNPGRRLRDLERFDLGREAGLRLERERVHAARRGVTVALRAEGDLSLVGDREALLLALGNLVSNAVDWSPPGGVVSVELSGASDPLELAVEDMGPGVPEDERDAIFEPFRRGRAAAGRRAGYGLGLALVRSAVQTHGGSVDVVSAAGGGARFRVRLPRGLDGAA